MAVVGLYIRAAGGECDPVCYTPGADKELRVLNDYKCFAVQ